jgi:hypothetical protein
MDLFNALERIESWLDSSIKRSLGAGTYHFGNTGPIQLDITCAIPVHIHIELDTLTRRLMNIYIRQPKRDVSKVKFDEVQTGEGPWECGGQDGLHDILCDLGGGDGDVGPQLLDDVVNKAWTC